MKYSKNNIHDVLDKLLISKAISFIPENRDMLVFPNPAHRTLNILINNERLKQLSVEIRNIRRKVVYKDKVSNLVGNYSKQIDVSSLAKGVYYLKVKEDEFVSISKIIIQ